MERILAATGLAVALLAPAFVSAHSGVGLSISLGWPVPVIAEAAPVHYYPPRSFYAPPPLPPTVYAPPRVVIPAPVYYPPRPVYGGPGWRWHHHHQRHHGGWDDGYRRHY